MLSGYSNMKDLLKSEIVKYINIHRSEILEEWNKKTEIQTETISDRIFDIVDLRSKQGSIKCSQGTGEATYFNASNLSLCFIRYEDFINQFRTYNDRGQIEKDWTKGWSRPDYIAYDSGAEKQYFIIHELSSGDISNKHTDGRKQLLNTVLLLCSQNEINDKLQNDFKERVCFLSAKGCVKATPNSNADSFMEIYNHLPDPIPIHNKAVEKRNFKEFETNAIKL
jgi:hypothetical protein